MRDKEKDGNPAEQKKARERGDRSTIQTARLLNDLVFGGQSEIRRQRGANQFLVVTGQDASVGIAWRRPDYISAIKGVSPVQQVAARNFNITLRCQARANQIALIGEEQDGIPVWTQVDAGAILQISYTVSLPYLIAGPGFKTDEFSGDFS